MTIEKVSEEKYYPKADILRRGLGLGIDFLGAWIVSAFFSTGGIGIQFLQIFVFVVVWLVLRVIVVYNNRGQSLGRWAFDMKVLDFSGRVPSLLALLKREGITGFGALLVAIALSNIIANPTAILYVIPLAIDCGTALSDTQKQLALHDRVAGTMIVSSRRGYSLDLKVKRLVDTWLRNVRR